MNKIIGYIDKKPVYFSERNNWVTVYGTKITISGVSNVESALSVAKKNLIGFSAVKEETK